MGKSAAVVGVSAGTLNARRKNGAADTEQALAIPLGWRMRPAHIESGSAMSMAPHPNGRESSIEWIRARRQRPGQMRHSPQADLADASRRGL